MSPDRAWIKAAFCLRSAGEHRLPACCVRQRAGQQVSARLIIGDQAIHFRQKHAGEFQFWDLGEQWKKLTGLPFVYALWLIRPEVTDAKSIAQRLRKLRDENLASLDDLIAEAVAGVGDPGNRKMTREFLSRYFRKHLRFNFGKKEKQGLQRFADLCAKHGLLASARSPVQPSCRKL